MKKSIKNLIKPASSHCDLFCGVYDPAQARIEAQAVKNTCHKYAESDDEAFRQRCVIIKEERAQLTKEHLWVLWTDYFKPEHLEKNPEIHDLFWRATKAVGESKKSMDESVADQMIELIDEIGEVFADTKPGYDYQAVVKNLNA